MGVIGIALAIVLAVLILVYLDRIIAVGVIGIYIAVGVAVVIGLAEFFSSYFGWLGPYISQLWSVLVFVAFIVSFVWIWGEITLVALGKSECVGYTSLNRKSLAYGVVHIGLLGGVIYVLVAKLDVDIGLPIAVYLGALGIRVFLVYRKRLA